MKRNYTFLRILAIIFYLFAGITVLAGYSFTSFLLSHSNTYDPGNIIYSIGGTLILTLLFVCTGQIITLVVNAAIDVAGIAEQIDNIGNNIYIIAKKAEEQKV